MAIAPLNPEGCEGFRLVTLSGQEAVMAHVDAQSGPSPCKPLRGIAETAVGVGGRATQVAANVLSGQEWSANLWNPMDIALDVLPGVAAASWRTWKVGRAAARAADVPSARQWDDAARLGRQSSLSAADQLDDAGRGARRAGMLFEPRGVEGEAGQARLGAASLGTERLAGGADDAAEAAGLVLTEHGPCPYRAQGLSSASTRPVLTEHRPCP